MHQRLHDRVFRRAEVVAERVETLSRALVRLVTRGCDDPIVVRDQREVHVHGTPPARVLSPSSRRPFVCLVRLLLLDGSPRTLPPPHLGVAEQQDWTVAARMIANSAVHAKPDNTATPRDRGGHVERPPTVVPPRPAALERVQAYPEDGSRDPEQLCHLQHFVRIDRWQREHEDFRSVVDRARHVDRLQRPHYVHVRSAMVQLKHVLGHDSSIPSVAFLGGSFARSVRETVENGRRGGWDRQVELDRRFGVHPRRLPGTRARLP